MKNYINLIKYHINFIENKGKCGLLLTIICLVAALGIGWPQAKALQQLELETAAMKRSSNGLPRQQLAPSPQVALKAFYQMLPAEQEATLLLNQMLDIAEQHQLIPEKVDYVRNRQSTAQFSRYQLNLPLKGHYPDIRHFIADIMVAFPSIALSEITLKRDETQGDQVEARLKLTLYLHKDGQ
ncbi:Pilus assembly protein, PilO [Methylobacillus rhizosphaerae]|uniref:Pilus assembly protein, PilO n=1 Tax=Methylobacillus rhizosphaerae TaxID=551994 RepID=A0A238ZN67_9PROT|nr:Pilus assembly protein, PilO [Methylobacillus rhizosphaerae]